MNYPDSLIIIMQNPANCLVCLKTPPQNQLTTLQCTHTFCNPCLKEYITVLKQYRQLSPEKLQCLHDECKAQIDDSTLVTLFPGEEGFLLKTIKKCYRQSKNPNTVVFCCSGLVSAQRKPLIEKTAQLTREEVTKRTNALVRQLRGKGPLAGVQECNSIHIHTGGQRREKYLQCYACGCGSCFDCFELAHQGKCLEKSIHPLLSLKQGANVGDNFQDFLSVNQMKRCLNAKCGLPIAKEEGCYWVKCRCSWQMCYPCGKLWGDCEHFSKYPYQKFVPPADWLVKVLKLY